MDARFIISAARPELFPGEQFPEIAILGRSNVGKSSLLNRLVSIKGLARTSSTPGCTRGVNFYCVDNRIYLVDLPGYGFSKVPKPLKQGWKSLIEAYLGQRRTLRCCLLLVDARRGWMESDRELRGWLEFHGRRYLVVATKFDKLKSRQQHGAGLAALRDGGAGDPIPFSAVTGQGVREIWQTISTATTP
jgi:GTP-binding protein